MSVQSERSCTPVCHTTRLCLPVCAQSVLVCWSTIVAACEHKVVIPGGTMQCAAVDTQAGELLLQRELLSQHFGVKGHGERSRKR